MKWGLGDVRTRRATGAGRRAARKAERQIRRMAHVRPGG